MIRRPAANQTAARTNEPPGGQLDIKRVISRYDAATQTRKMRAAKVESDANKRTGLGVDHERRNERFTVR